MVNRAIMPLFIKKMLCAVSLLLIIIGCPKKESIKPPPSKESSCGSVPSQKTLSPQQELLITSLEGGISLPAICQSQSQSQNHSTVSIGLIMCAQFRFILKTITENPYRLSTITASFYGFEKERLAFAEALLLTFSSSAYLPINKNLAVFIRNSLLKNFNTKMVDRVQFRRIDHWVQQWIEIDEMSRSYARHCLDHKTAECTNQKKTITAYCFRIPFSPPSIIQSIDIMRTMMMCLKMLPTLGNDNRIQIEEIVKRIEKSISTESDSFEMLELRLRMFIILQTILEKPKQAMSWLAYYKGSQYSLAKFWILDTIFNTNQLVKKRNLQDLWHYSYFLHKRNVSFLYVFRSLFMELTIAVVKWETQQEAVEHYRILDGYARNFLSAILGHYANLGFQNSSCLNDIMKLSFWKNIHHQIGAIWEQMRLFSVEQNAYQDQAQQNPTPHNIFLLANYFHRNNRSNEAKSLFALIQTYDHYKRLAKYIPNPVSKKPLERVALSQVDRLIPSEKNSCAPYTLYMLYKYYKVADLLNLKSLTKNIITASTGTSISNLLGAINAKNFELRYTTQNNPVQAVKEVLRLGYPLLLIGKAGKLVASSNNQLQCVYLDGHVTLVVGYDDQMNAFLVNDVNWITGISQISYHYIAQKHAYVLLPLLKNQKLPPTILKQWPIWTKTPSNLDNIMKTLQPFCLD